MSYELISHTTSIIIFFRFETPTIHIRYAASNIFTTDPSTITESVYTSIKMEENITRVLENATTVELDCPDFSNKTEAILSSVSFAIEGVLQTIVAILGIFGNCLASYVLSSSKEMRNAFNLLLVTLACFDSMYLFGSILESFRKGDLFNMATDTHNLLFPHLLYPFTQFTFVASIFMTVAIALERYLICSNNYIYLHITIHL